ncbi:hypothetical protein [Hydrocoleum sp. CS-953]|nr:hypothetical protein [Hydrocoleum sp. CS-953]
MPPTDMSDVVSRIVSYLQTTQNK